MAGRSLELSGGGNRVTVQRLPIENVHAKLGRMTIVESIANDLRTLPNDKLVEVARYVRELVPEAARRQREALGRALGCLDEETGRILEQALNECRQVPGE